MFSKERKRVIAKILVVCLILVNCIGLSPLALAADKIIAVTENIDLYGSVPKSLYFPSTYDLYQFNNSSQYYGYAIANDGRRFLVYSTDKSTWSVVAQLDKYSHVVSANDMAFTWTADGKLLQWNNGGYWKRISTINGVTSVTYQNGAFLALHSTPAGIGNPAITYDGNVWFDMTLDLPEAKDSRTQLVKLPGDNHLALIMDIYSGITTKVYYAYSGINEDDTEWRESPGFTDSFSWYEIDSEAICVYSTRDSLYYRSTDGINWTEVSKYPPVLTNDNYWTNDVCNGVEYDIFGNYVHTASVKIDEVIVPVEFTWNNKIIVGPKQLDDAVMYVPYSSGPMFVDTEPYTVELVEGSGTLPLGLTLDTNTGAISGVPQEAGHFEFTVFANRASSSSYHTFMLIVESNDIKDEHVDEGYEIIEHIGEGDEGERKTKTDYEEESFTFDNDANTLDASMLVDVYFNGDLLTIDDDYTAEDGSVKITIHAQTFERYGEGTHTIAAAFRESPDEQVRTVAQTFTVAVPKQPSPGLPVYVAPPTPSVTVNGVSVSYTVSGGKVTLDISDATAQELMENAENGNITLDFSHLSGVTSVAFGAETAEAFADAKVSLTIKFEEREVTLDAESLAAIFSASDSDNSVVTIELTAVKKSDLSAEQQALIPDDAILISISVTVGDKTVSELGNGFVTVSNPYELPDDVSETQVVPYYLNEDLDKLELVMGGYNAADESIKLKLRHLSLYVIKVNDTQYEVEGGWYDSSLDWAIQRGLFDTFIIDGKIDAAQNVSRGDFVTALLKSLGIQPMTSFTKSPFADVSGENAEYIHTAKELGIVNGTDNEGASFNPGAVAKRGEQFQIAYNLMNTKITVFEEHDTGKTISDFSDAESVPEWLVPALNELIKLGIVQGDGERLLAADDFAVGTLASVLQKMASTEARA